MYLPSWHCPECGYRNSGFNAYCASCGGPDEDADWDEPVDLEAEKADSDWGER